MNKFLMSGNSVVAEAAIRAGCQCYFGYPITPQNELTEYMAKHLSRREGCAFVQAESEISAINMVFGASLTGARAMTSSSSPGISLKQEGISYLAVCELPAVIVNMQRGGPGLGSISASQSDYFQATRGGGHGDYRTIVLAPESGQELADLTKKAFDLADRYRTPLVILGDGMLGQMMEPVEFHEAATKKLPEKSWALKGAQKGPSRIIKSFTSIPGELEEINWRLFRKYRLIEKEEVEYETYMVEDAEMVVVAYGIAARIAKGSIKKARENNLKVGMLRPITLWPFPSEKLMDLAKRIKHFFVFEMNMGQMVEDVRLALEGKGQISFYGRPGGVIPTPSEIFRIISRHYYQKGLNR